MKLPRRSLHHAFAWSATIFLYGLGSAQSLTPTLAIPAMPAGTSSTINVSFLDSSPTSSVAGLQWNTPIVPSGFTLGTPTAGAAAIAAGKTLSCSSTVCIVAGINTNAIASGVIAVYPVTSQSSALSGAITLPSPIGANVGGGAVAVIANAGILTISLPPAVWFTAKAGSITCSVSKVFQSPVRITYLCSDPYGSESGAYTATTASTAQNGTNAFYLDMHSMSNGSDGLANSTISCLIQINGTAVPVMMLTGQTVPATSATYSCNGFSTVGAGAIAWP